MDEIKWGFIGCGDVTEIKSGPAFSKIQGSSVVAVMRRNGAKAKDYAERHEISRWYDDAGKLINDPEVNAIYIATPPESHARYTKMAAEAQKPVYVEKPMALNYLQCIEMIEACEKAGVPLFVAYYRRYMEKFVKIKTLIDEGIIGDIRTVHIKVHQPVKKETYKNDWRVNPEIAGAGLFYDLASHQLDLMDYFFGPIVSAKGYAGNHAGLYKAEDIVVANFKFESGILGTGSWCFTVAESAGSEFTEIIGSKGKIKYATFDGSPILVESTNGIEKISSENPVHVQQPLISAVVGELKGGEKCISTGYSAARANKVMEMIVSDV